MTDSREPQNAHPIKNPARLQTKIVWPMRYPRLLFLLLLSLLVACGDARDTDSTDPASSPPAAPRDAAPSNPVAPQEGESLQEPYVFREVWTGDLDVMEERRVIRILTVYSPGRYYMDRSEEKGLVKEVAVLLEKFINKRLQRKHVIVHVVVIPVARSQLIPALLEGRGDLILAGLSITPERQEVVDFSIPATKPLSEILLTGPSAPSLSSIDDLSGQTVYVRHSSSYRESLERLNRRFVEEGRAPVIIEPASELLEDDDLVEMVNTGMLPWAIVDDYKVPLWDDVFEDLVVRDDIVFREGGRIAWAFRKGSPQLEETINSFLKKNREGTLTGNVLKNRWVKDFDWAANALAHHDFERFSELQPIFRKYGEQYGVDYLLAAAQGYQESRLDQNARSSAGAIGVMQMLPATARDPNVDIPDIHNADANIHAGIKYLAYLRDRYYGDPDVDDLNRTLLALATYNVGPRRMINLRNEALKLGYDPNVWFDNVEMVAAKRIGRETVQYVANIFKYFIAYRMTLQRVEKHEAARERVGIE
jgi:membrane-bound lytic murein transglycosylase MltF